MRFVSFFQHLYVDIWRGRVSESSMQHDSTVDELHKITLGLNSHMQIDHGAWWLVDRRMALACAYSSLG